jgi:RNA polymerase sigma-70 factor (ECF subfamily)
MSATPLDGLLEKLCTGDAIAAEQVFVAYEPYLRMVVRRQLPARLRAKFDSVDIVQSIWADVLVGFRQARWRFTDAEHLRAFLVKVTRHRFIDRLRQCTGAVKHERQFKEETQAQPAMSPQPRPSELAQAKDLWEQLLVLCPPIHHELLRLKLKGSSLDEIAAHTGLHKSSVRRILYDLARQLATRQQGGDRPTGDSA